jgi:predicted nucleic acid-binding protein
VTSYLDSSVLVAALVEDEPAHEACLALLRKRDLATWTYALAEVFATLTGGRLGLRVPAAVATALMQSSLLPRLRLIELPGADLIDAIGESERAGVRGGAILDFLHLVAARRSAATTLYTLNHRHFVAVARKGDPKVEEPG